MINSEFDVVGIGNAIVDVLAQTKDTFLEDNALSKGTMTIIGAETAEFLYAKMGPAIEVSGGSAANTIASLSSLGGKGAFVGKVRDDQLGDVFTRDIQAIGVHFNTPSQGVKTPTARSFIFVTPDAERTMQTFLGACVELGPDDIDQEVISKSSVTYLEGYLWDPPRAKEAFLKAAQMAYAVEVSLSLSDPFCVDRHRDEFLDLVTNHVNILFANEEEIKSLYQVERFDEALKQVRGYCDIAALTRGVNGSVIVAGDDVHVVDAEQVDRVVDTTGAGDAYAAGFLYGYTKGKGNDLHVCARLGGIAAAEIISHYGARPETELAELAANTLGQ